MTTISIPLNLDNVEVIDSSTLNSGEILLHVKSTENGTYCKHCDKPISKYHSLNKMIRLNHLPAFGTPVYIDFQPVRYQCTDCEGHPTTTQKPSWYQSTGHCTLAYAKHILNLLVNSTIEDVALQEGLSYKRVFNIIKTHVPDEVDWSKIKSLNTLGIDEISLKKIIKNLSRSSAAKSEEKRSFWVS